MSGAVKAVGVVALVALVWLVFFNPDGRFIESDADFIERAYQEELGHRADPAGKAANIDKLGQKKITRARLRAALRGTAEAVAYRSRTGRP